jgi:hypothetical protein
MDGFASGAIPGLLPAARAIDDDRSAASTARVRPSFPLAPVKPAGPAPGQREHRPGAAPRRRLGAAASADLLAAARAIGDDRRIRGGRAHRGPRRDRAFPTRSRHSGRGPSASRPSSLRDRRRIHESIGQEPRRVDGFAAAAVADLLAAARAVRDDQRIRGGRAHGGQERELGHLQ